MLLLSKENSLSVVKFLFFGLKKTSHGIRIVFLVELVEESLAALLAICVIVRRIDELGDHVDRQSDSPEESQLVIEGEGQDRHIQHKVKVCGKAVKDWPRFAHSVGHVGQLVAHAQRLLVMHDLGSLSGCSRNASIVVDHLTLQVRVVSEWISAHQLLKFLVSFSLSLVIEQLSSEGLLRFARFGALHFFIIAAPFNILSRVQKLALDFILLLEVLEQDHGK